MTPCKRCRNEPLCDFYCRYCGNKAMENVYEEDSFYDKEQGILFQSVTEQHRKRKGAQVICQCGCDRFDVKYQDYCHRCLRIVERYKHEDW